MIHVVTFSVAVEGPRSYKVYVEFHYFLFQYTSFLAGGLLFIHKTLPYIFSTLPVKQHTSKILHRPFMLQTVKFKVQWKQPSENEFLVDFYSESFHFGPTDMLNLDVYLFSTMQPAIIPRVCFAYLVRQGGHSNIPWTNSFLKPNPRSTTSHREDVTSFLKFVFQSNCCD